MCDTESIRDMYYILLIGSEQLHTTIESSSLFSFNLTLVKQPIQHLEDVLRPSINQSRHVALILPILMIRLKGNRE